MNAPLRVVGYARVSTANHEQDPQLQLREIRRFCASREWPLSREFIDHGFSGSSDNRPGLKEMLAMVRNREVDIVVVTKLDRAFRSLKHLITLLDEFQHLGVQFVCIFDPIDYTTPSGKLMCQLIGAVAQFELALLRERTRQGLEHARSKGKTLGRPRIGKEDEIRALRAKGLSYRKIAVAVGVSLGTVQQALRSAV